MSTWDKLSMADRAKYIKLAVQNGVTSLSDIRDIYNRYAEGGYYNAGRMVDAIYESATEVENLGDPDHHYDFAQTEEWADAHGYYPDERGHRDDRVKKPAHPTHPSKGKWNGLNEFQLTDLGMKDPNYIMFGMADGDQDPQATLTYNGSTVLPEFTVTPNGNYIHNSYDNLNIRLKRNGGKLNSNKYGDGSWMQSLMDGTLFTEPSSTESNEEQAQTQIQPTIPKEPIYLWEKRMQNMPVFTSFFRNLYEKIDKDKMPLINIEEMPLTYIEETVNKNFDKYPKSPNSSYEEAKKWMDTYGYIDYMNSQARNIQKKRIIDASHQDPKRTGRKYIPLNDIPVNSKDAKKFDLSLLEYDPDIIDLIATNLPEGYDIYEALTLPIHETHLGRRKTNLSTNEGRIRALINNHNYELDLHYFSDIAQYVRNAAKKLGIKKGIGNLILQTHDLEAFKKNNPKLYKEMNRDAKERFNEKRWEQNNSQYKDVDVPYMMHALLQYRDGKYNRGELGYVNDTKEYTKKLKQSPGLRKYLISKGYIK